MDSPDLRLFDGRGQAVKRGGVTASLARLSKSEGMAPGLSDGSRLFFAFARPPRPRPVGVCSYGLRTAGPFGALTRVWSARNVATTSAARARTSAGVAAVAVAPKLPACHVDAIISRAFPL